MRNSNGVELDRAVDSIRVGYRFRGDLGNLDELCASIQTVGLLQPITITPDGTLVCGARRLAAVRKLGWNRIKVWINSTISTRLAEVLAEQHENTTRKPLTPTEAAALYAELRQLYAADAVRRQQATRFSSEHNPRHHGTDDGGAESAPPSDPEGSDVAGPGAAGAGKARRQAARAITGRSSYWSLEHVAEVQRIANDQTVPESVRDVARRELAAMDADGTIHPHYLTVQAVATTDALARLADDPSQPASVRDHAARELTLLDHGQPSADLVKAAQAAIARATNAPSTNQADNSGKSSADLRQRTPMKRYGLRAFLSTIEEMDGWWQHYDPAEIASGLSDTQWQQVRSNLDGSIAFIDDIAAARDAAAQTNPVHGERAADQPPHAACF